MKRNDLKLSIFALLFAVLVALASACASIGGGSVSPGGVTPTDPAVVTGDRHVRITVLPSTAEASGDLVIDNGQSFAGVLEAPGRLRFDVPASAPYDFGATIRVRAEGFKPGEARHLLTRAGDQEADELVRLEAERRARARRGIVRLSGRTFVDDDGPFLAAGVTCFWCPWAYQHDRERLIANLACVAGQAPGVANCPRSGVDFLRVLVIVGPSGGWSDRAGDAREPETFERLAGLADLAFGQFGLRLEVTIFGGVDTAPTAAAREIVVRHVADIVASRPAAFQFVEIANEGTLNGFAGDEGKAELWRLAQVFKARASSTLVALTSPQGEDWAEWYRGSPAQIATVHLERNIDGTGGTWRPVRQARELVGFPADGWVSNEPIGPQSSVASDDDPTRLVMAAGLTWLCNGAGYVYHTGAGIRGGGAADLERGRASNFAEVSNFAATLDGLNALRAALPADLPNWTWHNGNNRFPAYPFELPYDDRGTKILAAEDDLLRAFIAIAGDRFVVMPIKVERAIRFTARRPMEFDVLEPLTGQALEHVTLGAGQAYTLTPRGAAVFVGRFN